MIHFEDKHFDFLEVCAGNQTHTHFAPEDISKEDLQEMVKNSILIEYHNHGSTTRYAATGSAIALLSKRPPKQFVKPNGNAEDLDMTDPRVLEAIAFVASRGYTGQAPAAMVAEWGPDLILADKRKEATL